MAARDEALPRRPTTPLQRISRNSLRTHSLSLSASRSRPSSPTFQGDGDHPCPPLAHLTDLFTDLADSFADLHSNLESLNQVQRGLDGFNESFGGLIYGLRMNAYTTDWPEAPDLASFQRASERRRVEEEEEMQRNELETSKERQSSRPTSPTEVEPGDETTFASNRFDHSIVQETKPKSSVRGGSSNALRGRGGSTLLKSNQQRQLVKWCENLITSLPIKYREQQPHRHEMEMVLTCLKQNPQGLYIVDFPKLQSTLPAHRARECVNVLVAAKHATKINQNGLLFKLDTRHLN